MERYQVILHAKSHGIWQINPPLIDPSEVEALNSQAAAKEVIERYLGKPVKLLGMSRPPDILGVFFETKNPNIVIHVEDLNILRPYTSGGVSR